MPKIQSAKKALRQNIKRRARNKSQLKKVRETIKRFEELVAAHKYDEAQTHLSNVYKILDKTAKQKIIKRGTAARLKSRLSKRGRTK